MVGQHQQLRADLDAEEVGVCPAEARHQAAVHERCIAESEAAVEREVYISANLASLSKEAAQGEGRHLLAFADVLGCAGDQSYPQFVKVSQEQHQAIFNSEDPQAVLNSYISAVKANSQLKTECARLGV